MIYYVLLISAAILFSSQFLFQQKYQNECGMTWSATLNFNIYSGIAGFVLMWLLGRGHLEFSWFSLGVAVVYAAVNITYNYASLKSFDTVNLWGRTDGIQSHLRRHYRSSTSLYPFRGTE